LSAASGKKRRRNLRVLDPVFLFVAARFRQSARRPKTHRLAQSPMTQTGSEISNLNLKKWDSMAASGRHAGLRAKASASSALAMSAAVQKPTRIAKIAEQMRPMVAAR